MMKIKENIWWVGLIMIFIGLAMEWSVFLSPNQSMDNEKRKKYIYIGAAIAIIGAVLLFWGLKKK